MKNIFTSFILLLLVSASAIGQVPRTISFQGILADASGNLLPDGNTKLSLSLYNDATGGSPIYSETQTVAVVKGRYNVIIGSAIPIPSTLSFSQAYFLGVSVEASAELTPRTVLTAAPYALHASIADGLSPNAAGAVTTLNTQSGVITLKGGGGTTISTNGPTITISSTGTGGTGVQSVQSGDGTLDVLSNNGPVVDARIAASAVTTKYLADNSVTPEKINSSGATTGQALVANGFGVVTWKDIIGTGVFIMPYSDVTASPSNAFQISNNGPGNAIVGITSNTVGTGAGVNGQTNSKDASAVGVLGVINATTPGANAAAVRGLNSGTNGNGMGVYGIHSGSGVGVYGQSVSGIGVFGISSTGSAASFSNTTAGNSSATVSISTNGNNSTALKVNHTGTNGNIAAFQSAGGNMARIDKTGKGFFNGGTQTGGADVAEAFAVVGQRASYQPGDVLVIAPGHKRTVEKCSKPYSMSVIGVHATKPGLLLTERDVEADLDDLVPMGVVGVLPTKVCNEGGMISAGDLLVTSSREGYAMKADPEKLKFGMALGKALEDFSGTTGMIEVFVNVK